MKLYKTAIIISMGLAGCNRAEPRVSFSGNIGREYVEVYNDWNNIRVRENNGTVHEYDFLNPKDCKQFLNYLDQIHDIMGEHNRRALFK